MGLINEAVSVMILLENNYSKIIRQVHHVTSDHLNYHASNFLFSEPAMFWSSQNAGFLHADLRH